MKKILSILVLLAITAQLQAQSNAPVRLALISETDPAATAVDILTVQFSSDPKIRLLERDQIARVYREQGLSAGNRDYLKLGQILGADGLLLLGTSGEGTNQFLNVRLIAVKPGVVLVAEKFSWPMKDFTEWTPSFAKHLDIFLPKLTVLAKNAIPISVVNLRSAVQSDEGKETEQQLKLLTIQRLSREPQLFILERQKMQLLTEEKDLKLDESAFWNGSYLLEGTVDQNGYSPTAVTINARLTPPKGGAPILFEVSGSRTNLTEVVNQLAVKVDEALKVNTSVSAWNAADEAQQYFKEAQWALKWGVFSEAQVAADSAWALGKQDLDCALVRVRSYVAEVSADLVEYQTGESILAQPYDADRKPLGPPPTEADAQREVNAILAHHPFRTVYHIQEGNGSIITKNEIWKPDRSGLNVTWTQTWLGNGAKIIDYISAKMQPDPGNIDRASHALRLYYELSQNEHKTVMSAASAAPNGRNSDWYNLGIEDLVAASRVLQDFNFVPDSQKAVADKLAELRASARLVAGLISQSPSVHDSYFVGSRVAVYDELAFTIGEEGGRNSNIFSCEAQWGCFWQETPEGCVALYRELMSSPVFRYIHNKFWFRELTSPRLIAWNEEDQKLIPKVWNDFVQELNASTNVLLRLEAKALLLAEVDNEAKLGAAFTNLFNAIFENHDALVANNVDVLYVGWGAGDLVERMGGSFASDTKASLRRLYNSEYLPKIWAMEMEYRNKANDKIRAAQFLQTFEKQKQYLKDNKPFSSQEFNQLFFFGLRDYSQAQAAEIKPLLAAYKSNLLAQVENLPLPENNLARLGVLQVGQVEANVDHVLNPPAAAPTPLLQPPPKTEVSKPAAMAEPLTATPTASAAASANMPEIVTNIITVGNFLPIPMDGFLRDRSYSHPDVRITAHHWFEGRLLLDFEFGAVTYTYDEKGNWLQSRGAVLPAIAILDPATEQWVVVSCPEADTMSRSIFYHRSVLWHGEIFNSDGNQIRKYDSLNHRWQTLKNSDGNNYELFVVNNHLYAANGTTIFEIADDGRATRILASARRNPPVSALDKLDNLGTPVLFAGTNQLLHAHVTNAVYLWQQDDWHKEADVGSSVGAELFEDGVLFRGSWSGKNEYTVPYGGFPQDDAVSLFQFAPQATSPELCLWQQYHYMNDGHTYLPIPDAIPSSRPLWKMPSGCYFTELAAALGQSNLYLLADHFNAEGQSVAAPYNAELFCFSSGLPLPQELFLKFDAPDGCPPLTKINPHSPDTWPKTPPAWILPTTNFLFIGLDKPAPPFINQNIGFGCKPGVWLLPVSKIGPAIAAQKQIQLDQMARERAVAEQLQKDLLTKYDRNHNGVIDPDEKEEALDDPAFIELELDEIDANHNGWLDAEELAWFDANTNKILELKEQAGIEIAQHLLAERLLKKFDANGDGLLNRQEFNNLLQSNMETYIRSMPGVSSMPFPFPDENHDGYVDLGELETFLKQQTSQGLRPRGMPGRTFFLQTRTDPNKPVDARQLFKAAVESYWQNPGGVTNQPPFNGRVPPGARFVPNGIPQGAAQ